jgi:hypothetical protein
MALPSTMHDASRKQWIASTIRGWRSVKSWPLRLASRTLSPRFYGMIRKPSCLISWSQPGPLGGSFGGRTESAALSHELLGKRGRRPTAQHLDQRPPVKVRDIINNSVEQQHRSRLVLHTPLYCPTLTQLEHKGDGRNDIFATNSDMHYADLFLGAEMQ